MDSVDALDPLHVARVQSILDRRFGLDSVPTALQIGRFSVLERIGSGAMGVVYSAYDADLERRAALKLLRVENESPGLRERLLREARAMAKIGHTNIASVFEAGEHDGRVFVAIELVRGQTLRDWQKSVRPGWREVVAAYVQAARGLAAAHGADVIHRDFKPDNAMIRDDGIVKVLDFGLARLHDAAVSREATPDASADEVDGSETPLTHSGALVGTPAYMAPEALDGHEATARTDQFSFCVAMFEALFGERPFSGKTVGELAAAMRGAMPKRPGPVPTWVRRILARGLAHDPVERWPSMDALAAALARDPTRARRRWAIAALAVAVTGGAVLVGDVQRRRAVAACDDEAAARVDYWSVETAGQIQTAFASTGLPYAPVTAEHVVPWISDQIAALQAAGAEACVVHRVENRWDLPTYEAATWCLDDRSATLRGLVGRLVDADAAAVESAVASASSLRSVEPCTDEAALRREPAPPADERSDLAALRDEVEDARDLEVAGRYADARELAADLAERAEARGWSRLVARARTIESGAARGLADDAAAERLLVDAYFRYAEHLDWRGAADAATRLLRILGEQSTRADDALAWNRHAELAVLLADDRGGLLDASRVDALAVHAAENGDLARARDLHEESLAIQERVLGPQHPRLGHTLGLLAAVQGDLGEHEAARAAFERELEIDGETLGWGHPNTALTRLNLGVLARSMGEYELSRTHLEEACAILGGAYDSNHPRIATCATNLGIALRALGDYVGAEREQRKAVAIAETHYGRDDPRIAIYLHNLAGVFDGLGRYDEAAALHERTIALYEKAWGPDHPRVAQALDNLAMILVDSGAPQRGLEAHRRALGIFETSLGSQHPSVALATLGVARALRRLGRPAEGIPLAERALELQRAASIGADWIADTEFVLARLLWEAPAGEGRDRARAVALTTSARDAYRSMPGSAKELALTEAWLREPGTGP